MSCDWRLTSEGEQEVQAGILIEPSRIADSQPKLAPEDACSVSDQETVAAVGDTSGGVQTFDPSIKELIPTVQVS